MSPLITASLQNYNLFDGKFIFMKPVIQFRPDNMSAIETHLTCVLNTSKENHDKQNQDDSQSR